MHLRHFSRARRPLVLAAAATIAALAGPAAAQINVVELTVKDVQAGLANGSFSVTELTQAFFDRIDIYEDTYNAFISLNPDALDEAAALDAQLAAGGFTPGPLFGVPVVVKDLMDMKGLVTTAGFDGFSSATGGIDMIPGDDAAVVTRLRAAGAVILGKTNTPDFAGDGTRTDSSVAGKTLNPYNLTKAPGGSSGGTATAVNASFAVLGLGTETGGSIENPSSLQALVGVKTTFGLTPLEGVYPIDGVYRDVVGPMAKTAYDAAVTLDVLAGPTSEDKNTFAAVGKIPAGGYAAGLSETSLEGKRFGLVGLGWRDTFLPLAEDTADFYKQAITVLESQGAIVIDDPFAGTGWKELYAERPGSNVGAFSVQTYLDGLGPDAAFKTLREWEELTGREFPGSNDSTPPVFPTADPRNDAYQGWRDELRELFTKILEDNDLDGLFFPQAGDTAPPLIAPPGVRNEYAELPSNIINDIGSPVVTMPFAYYDDGTPMTLAFLGDLWTEGELLSYAFDFEQATMSRVAPVLTVIPEPATATLLAGVALVTLRRRRAA